MSDFIVVGFEDGKEREGSMKQVFDAVSEASDFSIKMKITELIHATTHRLRSTIRDLGEALLDVLQQLRGAMPRSWWRQSTHGEHGEDAEACGGEQGGPGMLLHASFHAGGGAFADVAGRGCGVGGIRGDFRKSGRHGWRT